MAVEFRTRANDTTISVTWNVRELQQAVDAEKADALYQGALVVLRAARPLTPRGRTGRLRKSGYAKAAGGRSSYRGGKGRRKPPKLQKGTALAGFSQFYGGFQERGTKRHRAQPFLAPALEAKRTQAAKAVTDHMARKVGL